LQAQICGRIGDEIDNYQLWFLLQEIKERKTEKVKGKARVHGLGRFGEAVRAVYGREGYGDGGAGHGQ
jgi:hypothetical protein